MRNVADFEDATSIREALRIVATADQWSVTGVASSSNLSRNESG